MRSRFQKQLADSKLYSIQGFCKDLLEVADILGAATTSVPKEQLNGNGVNPHLKSLYEGLTMTETQLQKVSTGYTLIAFDERVTFWLQRARSLSCACAFAALYACAIA